MHEAAEAHVLGREVRGARKASRDEKLRSAIKRKDFA